MSLVLRADPMIAALADYLAAWVSGGYTFRLYTSPADVNMNTPEFDLVEPTVLGYAPVAMAAWGVPVISGSRAVSVHPVVTWTASVGATPELIRGYWVADSGGGWVAAIPRPDGPALWGGTGQTYVVYPRYTRRAE